MQAKIVSVYPPNTMPSKFGAPGSTTTRQLIELEDIAGAKIRVTVWDHPDMTEHKGKEYVFHAGKSGKGLEVRHGSFTSKQSGQTVNTVELSMSKAGQMQYVEVYKAQNPASGATPSPAATEVAVSPSRPIGSAPMPINGAKVGMAINNAISLIVADNKQFADTKALMHHVGVLSSDIIKLSNWLESGKLYHDEPTAPVVVPSESMEDQKKANIVGKDGKPNPEADEDVPY